MRTVTSRAETIIHNAPNLMVLHGFKSTPDAESRPISGEPRALDALRQGPGTVRLDWKLPATGTLNHRGRFNPQSEIHNPQLGCPHGVQLQYRVVAVKHAGATYRAAGDVVL